jgi:hypothetical protein
MGFSIPMLDFKRNSNGDTAFLRDKAIAELSAIPSYPPHPNAVKFN